MKLSPTELVTNGFLFTLLFLLGAAIGGVLARYSNHVVPEYQEFLRRVANVMETQEKEAKERRERDKDDVKDDVGEEAMGNL